MRLPADDVAAAVALARGAFDDLRGARLFITGGTGFFGRWLLETLLAAGGSATVLTRDPAAFAKREPHLAAAFTFVQGDVCDFAFPAGKFTHVIHAATEASAALNAQNPQRMREVIVTGTQRVLDFCGRAAVRRLLFVSSGAVYGRQRESHVPETAPLNADPASAYAEGKRLAETLCAASPVETVVARPFAFVGPGLPLDIHFAIGNFLADALAGRPIAVRGDGTPRRSYLYMSDLAAWLWTILARGKPDYPYNVGSARDLSIAEVARLVGADVRIARPPGGPVERYVPDVSRAAELGLRETVTLEDAIERTLRWLRASPEGS